MSNIYELNNVSVRLVKEPPLLHYEKIKNTEQAVNAVRGFLKDMDREVFGILCIKTNNQPICYSTISIGSIDCAVLSMREVFKVALLSNSKSIIAFHCHPSGTPKPSKSDIQLTDKLIKAGEILDIKVLDHIIIGCSTYRYYSLAQNKEMNYNIEYDNEIKNLNFK